MHRINLELFGPVNADPKMLPETGDQVAVVGESGRVRFTTIFKAQPTVDGPVLYGSNGERLNPGECYFMYTVDEASAE